MAWNNEDRANAAGVAVEAFQEATGTDLDDAAADLICDLLHWTKRNSQDPLEQVRRGVCMFLDERDYPPDGWAPADKLANVQIITGRGIDRRDILRLIAELPNGNSEPDATAKAIERIKKLAEEAT